MKINFKPSIAALALSGLIAPSMVMADTDAQTNAPNQNTTVTNPSMLDSKNGKETITSMKQKLGPKNILAMLGEETDYLPFDIDVPGQAFVSTGPYVGVPLQFAGSNLIVNSPSVNTDVQLLGIRKKIHQQLNAMGGSLFKEPYHSHLLLSGIVEGQANITRFDGEPTTSYLDITNVTVDLFFIGPSNWTLGFIELTYDNAPPLFSPYGSTYNSLYTVSNSRVFVNKAFITIGDFSQSPFYGSFGQFYVPFGTYSSVMVSDTLTKDLARTKARAFEFGFNQQGNGNEFYGSVYLFKGDSYVGSVDKVNNAGANLGLRFVYGWLSGDIGGGVIGNIADSAGMQAGTGFMSFERLDHRVPAYDIRGNLDIGEHINLIFEYIKATTKFDVDDMSFNGHGARPWAFDLEAAFSFYIGERPSSIGFGFGKSGQALAIGIPKARTSMVFTTSIFRNTLQSLEFRHDRAYGEHETGNGPIGAIDVRGACTAAVCSPPNRGDNAVTAQFDYYF